MTSMNAVLMKFFKLPPALRMILALAGFGSLATIIFFIAPALRTKQGRIWMLIIGGIALVVGLLIYLIVRLFRGKRSKTLDGALESQGPTRGDIAEQEQIYREKFRTKLADLKANGLSIYRLPWFVLVGEPGCGKTASLIHSGLDFPLGKDEVPGFGGTRNYNWWFTNDAVILDTAGRIAFQEEGTTDRVEWEFFLKMLKKNRPRCPVNGVIIAVPADKLLRDTPDERAQKATILRERLRQVHQTLGVRFPTFLLVTKMDLVGGFSEFFEEIRVDLQQRNQMFGWSRPGEFEEPFDPESFPQAFDDVYYRLRDWSMRYLQRKATEEELGLIVTFPEGLRELRGPLNDYISTIFQKSPLLEPPFFRGFYFTSAVQEGAPIFDVFARNRPGVTIPEQPVRAVDSKAFFIHDFYERKVFAENGLVFRSAQHVSLNKRMRKLVWIGSAAMLLLMMSLFTFGFFGVSDLVTRPRIDCNEAAKVIGAEGVTYKELPNHLELAQRLREHYLAYDRPWSGLRARALFIGANISGPRDDVRLIHGRYVIDTILRPIIRETEERLSSMEELARAPGQYVAALDVYTQWYGQMVGQAGRQPLDEEEAKQRGRQLETLLEFLDTAEDTRVAAVEQVTAALESLSAERRYFAREILGRTIELDEDETTAVITSAVQNLTDRWMPLTRLGDDPQDEFLYYWLRLAERLGAVRGRYEEALNLASDFREVADYDAAGRRFMELTDGVEYLGKDITTPPKPDTLARAWFDLCAFLKESVVPQTEAKRVKRFADQRAWIEEQWNAEFGRVLEALRAGAPNENEVPQREVYGAVADAQEQLRRSYDFSLTELRQKLRVPANAEPVEHYANVEMLLDVTEAQEAAPFDHDVAAIGLVDHPFGPYQELVEYLSEMRDIVAVAGEGGELNDLRTWPSLLAGGETALPSSPRLKLWFEALQDMPGRSGQEDIRQNSGLAGRAFWQPVELYELANGVWFGYQQRTVGTVLDRMKARCAHVLSEPRLPGLARLMPGFDEPVDELPFEHYFTIESIDKQQAPKEQAEPEEEGKDEDWRRGGRRPPAESPLPDEPDKPRSTKDLPPLVTYHTRAFLGRTLTAYYDARQALKRHGNRGSSVVVALDRAADAYIKQYFVDWNNVYDDYLVLLDGTTLNFLQKCRDGVYDWPTFQAELKRIGTDVADEFALRLEAVVREVVLFADIFERDERGDFLFQRVDDRLRELGPRQNLQDRLDDIGRTAASLQRRRGDAVSILSEQFTTAWRAYLRQVEKVGPDPKGVAAPPDQATLRDEYGKLIKWRRMEPEQVRLIVPLLDIAAYGEILLRHHLDRQLATLLGPHQNHYPIVSDARDEDPALSRLRQLAEQAMNPEKFVDVLREIARFSDDYGKLFSALHRNRDDQYVQVLADGSAWISFLYGDQADRLQQELPTPLKIKWAISKHEGTTSAGNFYNKLTITLPLLAKSGLEPIGPVEEEVRSGRLGSLPPNAVTALGQRDYEYRWSLFKRTAFNYAQPAVRVWDKNPVVDGPEQATAPWRLPGSPWSLLLLVGSDSANRLSGGEWIIPVMMQVASETIGFDIAIQFERSFPGPMSPVADPGSQPGMDAARKYLSGVRTKSN